MNRLLTLISLVALIAFGALAGFLRADAAQTSIEVRNILVGYDGLRTRVVIEANRDTDFSQFALTSGGLRYVLDFERLSWALPAEVSQKGEGDGAGGIQRFRFAHNSPTTSRLVFDLDEPMLLVSSFTIPPSDPKTPVKIVLDFEPTDLETFKAVRQKSVEPVAAEELDNTSVRLPASIETTVRTFEKREKYIVVLDAGHGGKDPGTLGSRGTQEKDVVLRGVLLLKDMLEATGRYDVVLTRDTDILVDHERRIEIARDAGADIFISFHADAAGSRDVSGASVYTLSSAGEKRVDAMISQKGWTIPLEIEPAGDAARDILQDFVTRETLTKSGLFAEILIPELEEVGPILRNSHREANFFVLLAPDVPAVLLEIGFLTNLNDEQRLVSETGLKRTMTAVADAIDLYFEREG